jgi:hypothetical protein
VRTLERGANVGYAHEGMLMGAGNVAAPGAGGSAPGRLLPPELEALANAQPDALAEVSGLGRHAPSLADWACLHPLESQDGNALPVLPSADALWLL